MRRADLHAPGAGADRAFAADRSIRVGFLDRRSSSLAQRGERQRS
jgi:hypothetical protein